MACHVMAYNLSSHLILSCILYHYFVFYCTILCCILSYHILFCSTPSCQIKSYCIIPYCIVSYRIVSYCIVSCWIEYNGVYRIASYPLFHHNVAHEHKNDKSLFSILQIFPMDCTLYIVFMQGVKLLTFSSNNKMYHSPLSQDFYQWLYSYPFYTWQLF